MKRTRLAGAIEVFDDVIPNHKEILDLIVKEAEWQDAIVGAGDSARRDEQVRDSSVYWIDPFNFRTPILLYQFVREVWGHLNDYGLRYERGFSALESVNVNRYLPGQQYHAHSDASGLSQRVISGLVYLNDDFEGGETEFPLFDESIKPQAGRLVIFPSNYAYVHAALPPSDGIKYSAAFWAVM